MSEYLFGVGSGRVSPAMRKRIDAALKGTDVDFNNPRLPEGARYWFAAPNRGEPFDRATKADTWERLEKAGCLDSEGYLRRE